jgi:hypothetical protein
MSERTTDKILKDLLTATKTAATQLDSLPWQVRPGFGMAKANALAEIPLLRREYRDQMLQNTIFLFPVGAPEATAKFAEVSSKEGSTVTVDSDEIYGILADRVEGTLGKNREFGVHQFTVMNDAIDDFSKESPVPLKVSTLVLTGIESTNTHEELVNFIKRLITGTNGNALSMHCMGEQIVNQAIEKGFQNKVLVVVTLNADKATQADIAAQAKTSRSLEVTVPELDKITKAFAIDTFKQAQKVEKKTV